MKLRSGKKKITPETYAPRAHTAMTKQKKLDQMKDAKLAVPSLFAKPGDMFEIFLDLGDLTFLRYVGRNDRPSRKIHYVEDDGDEGYYSTPKKGWLIFDCNGTPLNLIRDALNAWPVASYSLHDEIGDAYNKIMLCVPPGKCGPLVKYNYDSDEEEQKGGDDAEEVVVSEQLLREAKAACPAIFAQPGDRFEWAVPHSFEYDPIMLTYVGRNETPPEKVVLDGDKPQLGWLVFKGKSVLNGGIRDGLHAWPKDTYTHYNDEGEPIGGTLCIPPEKCGPLKKCKYNSFFYY